MKYVFDVGMAENSPEESCLENSIELEDACLVTPLENTDPDDSIVNVRLENTIENVSLENTIENVCLVETSIENVCLENLPESEDRESTLVKDTAKSNRAYRIIWEKEEEFDGWLTQGSSADKAYCKWCSKEFRAHKSTLSAHATSESHKRVSATTGGSLLLQNQITFVNIATLNGSLLTTPENSLPAEPNEPSELPNEPPELPNKLNELLIPVPSATPPKSTVANPSYLPFSSRKGQIIGSGQKRLIVNLYMYKLNIKKVPKHHIPTEIHVETGLGLRSIKEIIKEYYQTGTVKSPTRKRPNCRNCYEKLNATQIEMIRNKIQQYFGQKEVPTINKMLEDVNADPDLPSFKKTSFHRVLHHLGYEWVRRGRNRLLVEQKELKAWKEKYLENFHEYRNDSMDETWLNVADAVGKRGSE